MSSGAAWRSKSVKWNRPVLLHRQNDRRMYSLCIAHCVFVPAYYVFTTCNTTVSLLSTGSENHVDLYCLCTICNAYAPYVMAMHHMPCLCAICNVYVPYHMQCLYTICNVYAPYAMLMHHMQCLCTICNVYAPYAMFVPHM